MNKKSLMLGLAVVFSISASANNTIQTGRYTQTSIEPISELKNPLDVVINVKIPNRMTLVGESFEYLLLRSGYRIKQPSAIDNEEMYVLFSLPIPSQHRKMGTLRLKDALGVLAGDAYQLHVNSVTRQIWFTLKEERKADLAGVDLDVYKSTWENKLESHSKITLVTDSQTRSTQIFHDSDIEHYGPIIPGETLGKIASKINAQGISISQRLVAIFEANKHAFINDNINNLKVGETLKIPSLDVMSSYDTRNAQSFESDQYQKFLAGENYDR